MNRVQKILGWLIFILVNVLILVGYGSIVFSENPIHEKILGVIAMLTIHLLWFNVATLFYDDMK